MPKVIEADCVACGACADACPVGAITMTEGEEGFMYPVIDPDKCIRCGSCLKVCAFKKDLL